MSATSNFGSTTNSASAAALAKIDAAKNSDWVLCRGIREMLRCDESGVVQGIAHYVISQHRSLRLLSALIEKTRNSPLPGLIALIGWLRSFLSVRSIKDREDGVWIARLSNERRAIEPFLSLSSDLNWHELEFRPLPDPTALLALLKGRNPKAIFRITRRLHRRYHFFKVLRVIEFIGFHTRYAEIFQQGDFKIALVSNHSNPHGIAFNLAARKLRIPTVLITHGMPVRPVARLSYNLAVVHNEAAHQSYAEDGCLMGRVLIHGRRQNYAAMPKALPYSLSAGIFLCKDVNEHRLRTLTAELLSQTRIGRVLIRPHPKNLWKGLPKWIESLRDGRVTLSSCGSVSNDIQQVDIVLGGNSSVLVDAVTAGRPVAFVANLDSGPPDLHCFVARGLVYSFDDDWNPDAMLNFYHRPEWPARLKVFANIDEDPEQVRKRAVAIMSELALEARSPISRSLPHKVARDH
ncbi:MAG: hypothetical protein DMF72_19655 [Acidobacteria bacterium]|nr:MAG: hypothetical protein DMF72_19655 [Acidobacteriota bacterium]